MNITDLQCEETGWRRCDRIAVTGCVICGSALCEPCRKRHSIYTKYGDTPTCSKPSCKRLVCIANNYDQVVAETRGWHVEGHR